MPCHCAATEEGQNTTFGSPGRPAVPQGAGLEGRGSGSDVRVDFCFVHQYNSPRASESNNTGHGARGRFRGRRWRGNEGLRRADRPHLGQKRHRLGGKES
jgi:hypothetical protein